MEVAVPQIVFLPVYWETSIFYSGSLGSIDFTNAPSPSVYHKLLLIFDVDIKEEAGIEMKDAQQPQEPDPVLTEERFGLPIDVAEGILEEASEVLKSSPFLSVVPGFRLLCGKLRKVAVSPLSQSSIG